MRICSLLPSATEIVCAIGMGESLVAVTHECDFPTEIAELPRVTRDVLETSAMSSRDIDTAVREALGNLSTLYMLDREMLARLGPDIILTQELCEVCAVSFERVQRAAQEVCPQAEVVSLEPRDIEEILGTIRTVGEVTGASRASEALITSLSARIEAVRAATESEVRRRVLAVEWLDPLFIGGHWVPEMVTIAGGYDIEGRPGSPSRHGSWEEVERSEPEVIVLMPCGMSLDRTVVEFNRLEPHEAWNRLPAVRTGEVWAVDGSSYFNRPGPRIVDGVEILGKILHPKVFGQPTAAEAVRLAESSMPAVAASRNPGRSTGSSTGL